MSKDEKSSAGVQKLIKFWEGVSNKKEKPSSALPKDSNTIKPENTSEKIGHWENKIAKENERASKGENKDLNEVRKAIKSSLLDKWTGQIDAERDHENDITR